MRRDEIEKAWEWVDGVNQAWKKAGRTPRPIAAGSWGPPGAFALIERDGPGLARPGQRLTAMPARIVLSQTTEDAAGRAADALAAALSAGVRDRGAALLAVSGGRTPVPVFQALSARDLDWSRVTVTLVDERWVDPASSDSNQRLVETHLLQYRAAASRFVPMKSAGAAPEDGVAPMAAALGPAPVFDAVLLGMGEDGHFASLFPSSPALAAGLDLASDALAVAVPAGQGGLGPRRSPGSASPWPPSSVPGASSC